MRLADRIRAIARMAREIIGRGESRWRIEIPNARGPCRAFRIARETSELEPKIDAGGQETAPLPVETDRIAFCIFADSLPASPGASASATSGASFGTRGVAGRLSQARAAEG
jgi:hypothetical protein